MNGVRTIAAVAAVVVTAFALGAAQGPAVAYNVYAIQYGIVEDFRMSSLIADGDSAERMDISMMVWLLKAANGRHMLIDAGFHRDAVMQWLKPTRFTKPSEAVARFGVKPEDITDIVITHIHFDHVGGADLFPNARIWIQRDEYNHYVDDDGKSRESAIHGADAAMLARLHNAGRVTLVDGDGREIIPGIKVYTGGKHTFASQFVSIRTAGGVVVIASDDMHLYASLERHVPIAQTLDPSSNLRAHDRMRTIASRPGLIVPGHDPEVFKRFPSVLEGVAEIR